MLNITCSSSSMLNCIPQFCSYFRFANRKMFLDRNQPQLAKQGITFCLRKKGTVQNINSVTVSTLIPYTEMATNISISLSSSRSQNLKMKISWSSLLKLAEGIFFLSFASCQKQAWFPNWLLFHIPRRKQGTGRGNIAPRLPGPSE